MSKQIHTNPKAILQKAVEALNVFTHPETSRLDLSEDGRLVASQEKSSLKRIIHLARSFIGPLFSEQLRKKRELRLKEIKKALLNARDIIQSHSALIERFKEGDEGQKKLAESTLSVINRYNDIVAKNNINDGNYERLQLLCDQEIKNQPIELPVSYIKKYDSHSKEKEHPHPAYKVLEELSHVLNCGAKKELEPLSTTLKNRMQFMIDAFRLKATRLMTTYMDKPFEEVLPLVRKTLPEVEKETDSELVMNQLIYGDSGTVILVTGKFKKNLSPFPILSSENFRLLSFELTHTGFPFPSQHTGWTVGEQWIEASPLRPDQTPLYQHLNQRRKKISRLLATDKAFTKKFNTYFKNKKDVFDHHRHEFLLLHRKLIDALHAYAGNQETATVLNQFYKEAENAPSPFDFICQSQQQVIDKFINQPIRALEEEWLNGESTSLREGSCHDKFQTASHHLTHFRHLAEGQFNLSHYHHNHIIDQGLLLGGAFQAIALQYQSEKIGFSPPLLNGFERKLQACAFQQISAFLYECENMLEQSNSAMIRQQLLLSYANDLSLIQRAEEIESPYYAMVDELEYYFNSRFYQD